MGVKTLPRTNQVAFLPDPKVQPGPDMEEPIGQAVSDGDPIDVETTIEWFNARVDMGETDEACRLFGLLCGSGASSKLTADQKRRIERRIQEAQITEAVKRY